MTAHLKSRLYPLLAALLIGVTACNQGETVNSGIVEAEAYLDIAELYHEQGQYRASIIEAQNALQALPSYNRTKKFLARLNLDLSNINGARDLLESVLVANPDDIEASLMLAESHLNSRNQAQALALLENLQSDITEHQVQRLWLLGLAYAQGGNSLLAYETLRLVLEIDPDHLPSLINLSMLEYQSGNEFAAQEFVDQAVVVDPNDLDLWVWRGQFALLQEQYAQSEQAFFEALEIMGNYDAMTAKRMSVLQAILVPLQMQNKNDEAMRYSQIIAETPQGQLQSTLNSALSLFQDGNVEQAELALNSVLAAAPDHPGSNVLMGMMRYAQGDFQAAQQSLEGFVNVRSATPEVIKTLAITHLRMNQADRALSVLQAASEIYPEDGSLLALIGQSQQLSGDIELSIETLERALELMDDSPDLHYTLANSYVQNAQTEQAEELYLRALRINPDHMRSKAALLGLYIRNERVDDARAAVAEWIARDSTSSINMNLAGEVEYVRENYSDAAEYFNRSIELDPQYIDARLNLARISIVQRNLEEAENQLNEALKFAPANVQAIAGLLSLGQLADSADSYIAQVKEISENNPEEFTPAVILATYYLSLRDLENAREQADKAFGRRTNSMTENVLLQVLHAQIDSARSSSRIDPARELVSYALQIQPNNVLSLIRAAGIEAQSNSYAAAKTYIDRIEELEPEGSMVSTELRGDLAMEEGQYEQALAEYRKSWDSNPNSTIGTRIHTALVTPLKQLDAATAFLNEWESVLPDDPTMHLLKGMWHQEQGEEEAAVARFETAVEQMPDNIVLLNNLGWLHQDDNPERALQLSSRAAELAPQNADVLDTYGWILFKQNQQDHAIQVLEQALELAPDSAAIQEHLATARQ